MSRLLSERHAIRDFLLACAAEANRQRLNMLQVGRKLEARRCGAESNAYANAARMVEGEEYAAYRTHPLREPNHDPRTL